MNTPSAKLLVLTGDKFACIKIIGRANFNSSIDFKTLVNELKAKGFSYFVLDLSECLLMDSTFLGVLAGFGLKFNTGDPDHDGRQIELYNPNPRITELLENLGVLHLFRFAEEVDLPPSAGVKEVEPGNPTKEQVTNACLEAHRTLMELNPGNVARFKEVTQFLAEDLKRMKKSEPAPAQNG
ncbi:MAG TPA: STAS domain-containing protein [Clostridia bacterium]|nr:STAS domain-containing protein [Clostridia bacterium]